MSVGKVGGRKGAGGASGAKGAGGPARAGGKGFGAKVGKSESLVGASREVSTADGAAATEAVTPQALEIARQLKSGQLKSREEATRKLVAEILREKLRLQSKALTQKIADALQDDPRLNQALERLWNKG